MRMNRKTGVARIKIVWMLVCFVSALAIALWLGARAPSSKVAGSASIAAFVAAAAISITPQLRIGLKNQVAIAIAGGLGASLALANIANLEDPIYGAYKPAVAAAVGALLWLMWTAAAWIAAGFRQDR